jgi:hypothetical protein
VARQSAKSINAESKGRRGNHRPKNARFLATFASFRSPESTAGWLLDALAYFQAARSHRIPAAPERSRSRRCGQMWILFADRIPEGSARRIGVFLAREAMTVRPEMDLVSYDRLFPAQDFLPKQGFRNLIALPLEDESR